MDASIDFIGTPYGKPCVMFGNGRTVPLWVEEMGHMLDTQVMFGIETDSYSNQLTHLVITDTYSGKAWLFLCDPQRGTVEFDAAN